MAEKLYKEFDQCPICGDALLVDKRNSNLLKCDCCGFHVSIETKVNYEDAERLKAANDALRSYDFEGAEDKYNLILEDNKDDSTVYLSALFGKLLSLFGVVYIKDFNGEAIPTFSEFDPDILSIKDTEIYHLIENSKASSNDKKAFLEKIDELDSIYKKIGKELDKKPLFDFFICTKISRRTPANPYADGLTSDSSYASNFYELLKNMGYRVFYSDKCCNEIEYDSQILSALLRSEKMLVISTSNEYLESPWVQSEWRRWVNFINCGVKEKSSLVMCLPNYDTSRFELPRVLRKAQRYTSEIATINAIQREKQLNQEPVAVSPVVSKREDFVEKVTSQAPKANVRPQEPKPQSLAQKKEDERTFKICKDYAEKRPNDPEALMDLAACYENGVGCEIDLNKTLEICKKILKVCKPEDKEEYLEYHDEIKEKLDSQNAQNKNIDPLAEAEEYFDLAGEYEYQGNHKKAFEYYKKAADLGYDEAQLLVGDYYANGDYVVQDLKKAFEYYDKSASKGLIEGIASVAICYEYGRGCEENLEKALELYDLIIKNCDPGVVKTYKELYDEVKQKLEAQNSKKEDISYTQEDIYNSIQEKLTNIYNSVSDMNITDEEFLGLAKKEIKIREKDLFLAIAVWYHRNGEISNHLEYAEKYYNLSENGEAYATLGTNYLYGYDFKENKEKAVHYFTLASDKGNHRAQYNLAVCYIYGDGCNVDYAKAFEYAQKASNSDTALFSRALAQIYEFGLGCPVNHGKALELLAKDDSPIGYYNFAHHHLSGRFGKKDKKSAVDFFKIAAQKGYDPAIKQLKKMFIFKY